MARLPYANPDTPQNKALASRIISERGSVLHLYRMLLHSPPLAEGWLTLLTAVRQKFKLAGALRELVIMRVAVLNGATYEADQHAPIALREGVTREQLAALERWEAADVFTPLQRAALRLTDAMTRDVHIDDAVLAAVREHLPEQETVELVATIAAYNMVSRFLEALAIRSDDDFVSR